MKLKLAPKNSFEINWKEKNNSSSSNSSSSKNENQKKKSDDDYFEGDGMWKIGPRAVDISNNYPLID